MDEQLNPLPPPVPPVPDDDWRSHMEVRLHNMEILLQTNTALTQDIFDLMRLGKIAQQVLKWGLAVVASGLAIWHGWGKP